MIYPKYDVSSSVTPVAPSRRRAIALSVLCVSAWSALACSAAATEPESNERNNGSFQGDDVNSLAGGQATKGTVLLDHPYLSGTCPKDSTVSIKDASDRIVAVIFSNQTYEGDRNNPDYVKDRTAGRLIGDAKSTTPKCFLHVPMKVTAGYHFSPTAITVRGFAHRAFIYAAYRWANAAQPSPANGWEVTNDGYTFERQVPENEPPDLRGDNFTIFEPLYNLWSPTCATDKGAELPAELIVTLQPYTADGTNDTVVAVDSFDVTGFGSIQKCDQPINYDPVAQEGESCGVVDMDANRPVRCDTGSQKANICVYPKINQGTGKCVNMNRAPAPNELAVGLDEDCGGPFYKYCAKPQGLVCEFGKGDDRQNASSHYGRCVDRLAVGAACKKELYGDCNGNTCNTTIDPCVSGSACSNGKCVTKKSNGLNINGDDPNDSQSADGDPADSAP